MNRINSDKPQMIAIYENTPNAFKKTENKLFDYDTKVEIEKYSEAFTKLQKNKKLGVYSIFNGKFKDNNKPFTYVCRGSIIKATENEKKGDNRMTFFGIFLGYF